MTLSFDQNGLIPVIIQLEDGTVGMLAYMNQEALTLTKQTEFVHFWSRSRKKIWLKGEESGNKLKVKEMFVDCDKDTLLIKAELVGTCVCHTGHFCCFFEKFDSFA